MDDVEALSTIVALLKQLEPEAQRRVLHSVETFLAIPTRQDIRSSVAPKAISNSLSDVPSTAFSRDRTISPKEFLRDKHPVTDSDRVTCLAFYLTRYRQMPQFKTVDISSLNTEAAQPKFSNASVSVDNASRNGYLVAGTKGAKQISTAGEMYVELLPDREAAKEAFRNHRAKRNNKKRKTKKSA